MSRDDKHLYFTEFDERTWRLVKSLIGPSGSAIVTNSMVAKAMGYDVSRASRAIRRLEDFGLIRTAMVRKGLTHILVRRVWRTDDPDNPPSFTDSQVLVVVRYVEGEPDDTMAYHDMVGPGDRALSDLWGPDTDSPGPGAS